VKPFKIIVGVFLVAAAAATAAWYGLQRDVPTTTTDITNPRLIAHGQKIYAENCALCHGVNLEGQPRWDRIKPDGKLPAPPHDPSGHTWHHSDQRLFLIIKEGLATEEATDMPIFGGVLSDHDIWAVLTFIKSTWPEDIRRRQPIFRSVPAS